MSCQCLFLPRQEIRECVCLRRTQQHSHGNDSSPSSIPHLRSTMRPYSSLLPCLEPQSLSTHPDLFLSLHMFSSLFPVGHYSEKVLILTQFIYDVMSRVSGAWVLVGSAKKVQDYSMCLPMHVCVTMFCACVQAACIQ